MGKKRFKQRAAVGLLGKELTRRSRGRCELCAGKDAVRGFELIPYDPEPDMDRSLMTCSRCREWLESGESDLLNAWFLSEAVWSEVAPVRLAAARMLLTVNDVSDPWMRDAFDQAGVDPVTGEFYTA